MDNSSLSFLHDISNDDRYFANLITDKIYAAENKYRTSFTFFLTEARLELAEKILASRSFKNYRFFGGYDGAERVMLGLFPEHEDPEQAEFPLTALTFSFRPQDKPTHRDFLGSLMSLNISRETVGDILVGEGIACVFLTDTAAELAMQNLTKVGKVGVKISKGYDQSVIPVRNFKAISGTVSSLRLDCVASLAAGCSRAKTQQAITGGAVSVRGSVVTDVSKKIEEGNTFSIRGKGKFLLANIGKSTKKDRIFIEIRKFI